MKDQAFYVPVMLYGSGTELCALFSEKKLSWKAYKLRRVQSLTAAQVESRLLACNFWRRFLEEWFERSYRLTKRCSCLFLTPTGRMIAFGHLLKTSRLIRMKKLSGRCVGTPESELLPVYLLEAAILNI